jgi:Ca2+:H+ antiporter
MGIEECSAEPGGADDDLPDLTISRHARIHSDVLTNLPSDGYQIFNEPPRFPVLVLSLFVVLLTNIFAQHKFALTSHKARWLVSAAKKLARNWSNLLLIFVPIGILAPHVGASHTAVFVLNCIAIVPLADILCQATDQIAAHFGETTGALLNVTMGNCTEIVILYALSPLSVVRLKLTSFSV